MHVYTCVVALVLVALPLKAQGPTPVGLRQHVVEARSEWTASFAKDATPATHWKEGMFIGAGVCAVLVLLIAATGGGNGVGDSRHGVSVWQIVGSLTVFSLVGGLIGSASPKR